MASVGVTTYIHHPALYLLASLFLLGAQSRFTFPGAYLTPGLHRRTNAQTTRTRDAELVRPLLYLSPAMHQRVVGAMMGLCGVGMLVPSSVKPEAKTWSLWAGLGMNLWGFANRYRAGVDVWKFSPAWVVLVDLLVVLGTLQS